MIACDFTRAPRELLCGVLLLVPPPPPLSFLHPPTHPCVLCEALSDLSCRSPGGSRPPRVGARPGQGRHVRALLLVSWAGWFSPHAILDTIDVCDSLGHIGLHCLTLVCNM